MSARVSVVTAGLGTPSSTALLAARLTAAVRRLLPEIELDTIELRPLAHDLADAMLTGFVSPRLDDAQSQVRVADAVIAVTPVFSGSYSGLFKTFFDVLDPEALAGTPVLIAATAGTARHSLVLDHAMRPLFSYLRAVVLPTGVFAAAEDWGDTSQGALADRIDRAATELVDALGVRRRPGDPGHGAAPGAQTFRDEDFGEVPDFTSLLGSPPRR